MKESSGHKALKTDTLERLLIRDKEIEEAVLYCLIFSREARDKISQITNDDFEVPGNKKLFSLLEKYMDVSGMDFDPLVLPDNIRTNTTFLHLFNSDHILTANFKHYLSKLRDASSRRKLEKIAYDMTVMVRENRQIADIKSKTLESLENIESAYSRRIIHIRDIDINLDEYMENNDKSSLATGFTRLDETIDGFRKGALYAVGGVPAVGKTTFILNIVNNLALRGINILFVSLEMSYREVEVKLISNLSGLPSHKIKNLYRENDEKLIKRIQDARSRIFAYNLYFIGSEGSTVYEIEEAVNNIGGIEIVFIDYLQRIKHTGSKDRYDRISQISSNLKTLSTKFDIPVVTVASINRSYTERNNKKPMLSDFRDSGNIEYDLDVALLLHREAQFSYEASGEDAKLIIAKNRYGKSNVEIDMEWKPENGGFIDARQDK